MLGWEDEGDLLRMEFEASDAAQGILEDRLGLAGRSEGETTGGMRVAAKQFREALLDEIVPA